MAQWRLAQLGWTVNFGPKDATSWCSIEISSNILHAIIYLQPKGSFSDPWSGWLKDAEVFKTCVKTGASSRTKYVIHKLGSTTPSSINTISSKPPSIINSHVKWSQVACSCSFPCSFLFPCPSRVKHSHLHTYPAKLRQFSSNPMFEWWWWWWWWW